MKLRICDDGNERIVPASMEAIDRAFAPEVSMQQGTEITLVEGEQWLAAFALGAPARPSGDEAEEFLLSGVSGDAGAPTERVGRNEALRRFRKFMTDHS